MVRVIRSCANKDETFRFQRTRSFFRLHHHRFLGKFVYKKKNRELRGSYQKLVLICFVGIDIKFFLNDKNNQFHIKKELKDLRETFPKFFRAQELALLLWK
jgi:hypothetical protein